LVVAIEDDATTPTDHARAIYDAARGPRRLVLQRHTTHYAAYDQYWIQVTPIIVDWFERHLRHGNVVVTSGTGRSDHIDYLGDDS
jgi:fermentation-respiration switch protein FrsA (DUF1100 family)